jgi:hypothetical protein
MIRRIVLAKRDLGRREDGGVMNAAMEKGQHAREQTHVRIVWHVTRIEIGNL